MIDTRILRGRGGRLRWALVPLILPLLSLPAPAAEGPPEDGPAAEETAGEGDDSPRIVVEDDLTVTGGRLRGEPRELLAAPNNVTVISRQEIDSSTALTLQELLSTRAGVVLFDQVGDGVSLTLDLRGFGGTGTRVLLDGAPINDPRNNSAALELVPLAALERIEVVRGSTAALAGGGSEAGVLNLWTRRGADGRVRARLAAGSDETIDAGAHGGVRAGETDLFLSGSRRETDGHRENSAGELTRLAATAAGELAPRHSLRLSLLGGRSDLGSPGALTAAELAADRRQAPFNRLDFSDELARQATLDYRGVPAGSLSLAANLYHRDRGSEILSTGRAAPLFGGFFLDSEADALGATVELRRVLDGRAGEGEVVLGAEWLEGETDARGFFTSPDDPGAVDPAGLGSDNLSERLTGALYLQGRWSPAPRWSLVAGARLDEDEVRYTERFPDPANRARRRYSELSLRAGVNYAPGDRWGLYLSYGESYLPPTIEELFAFPLFGSNPDLEPEDSRSWEAGVRTRLGRRGTGALALFRTDTEDEIVFDPASPRAPFGANVNGGRARREGIEASARGPLGGRVNGFVELTLMEAERLEVAGAPDRAGRALPLVPEERISVGIDASLPGGLDLRAAWLRVGEQPLGNDDLNLRRPLPAYSVLDARLAWRLPAAARWTLYLDARNLLDEEYSTRGIFAFDFAAGSSREFFTPAPDRRLLLGVMWER
ncbi:MAG: TonB-dependent receptor [Thermoanaerobaculia bacterium]|nr:TonB-dependent receptor [Thermoanaerobaculia bacterium]